MRNISKLISEKRLDSVSLLQSEISQYFKLMNQKLPKPVQAALYILNKYPQIDTKDKILAIFKGNSSDLNRYSTELNIDQKTLKDLQSLLKKMGEQKFQLLPHFQSESQRQALLDGKIAQDDLTMDLDSDRGRSAVAKQYTPLVYKIVNQYEGKSGLDKAALISAGLMGLTYAMNTYKKPEDDDLDKHFNGEGIDTKEGKKAKGLSFKQYAGWCIRNQILTDMNEYSRTVKISAYNQKKLTDAGETTNKHMSIDTNLDPDGDDIKIDRIGELSEEPDYTLSRSEEKAWNNVFKIMEKQFTSRDCEIFYKYFGLNDRKKEKGKDIAKMFNLSPASITLKVQQMISWLKQDDKTMDVLRDILGIYTESLMNEIFFFTKDEILETLYNDNIFLLLEELTKWNTPESFMNAIEMATSKLSVMEAKFIIECLANGFEYLDSRYRKNKNTIINFLEYLYPTETFKRKSDVSILDKFNELIRINNKLKIDWYN